MLGVFDVGPVCCRSICPCSTQGEMLALLSCFVAAAVCTLKAYGMVWLSILLGHEQKRGGACCLSSLGIIIHAVPPSYCTVLLFSRLSLLSLALKWKLCVSSACLVLISPLGWKSLFFITPKILFQKDGVSLCGVYTSVYVSPCKYINAHCYTYAITQSTALSIAEILLVWGFFYIKKGQILEILCFCGGVCSVFVILMICL